MIFFITHRATPIQSLNNEAYYLLALMDTHAGPGVGADMALPGQVYNDPLRITRNEDKVNLLVGPSPTHWVRFDSLVSSN